jgi:hypothetical protein
MNISIYALTLPMLVKLAVNLYGYPIPGFGFVYWAVSILYVVFAVRSCIDEINRTEAGNDLERV